MKFSRNHIKWLAFALMLGGAILVSSVTAGAQCSMCRASLAGSNANFIRNFNIGVLVLLAPPVAMFCSFFVLLRRNKDGGTRDK